MLHIFNISPLYHVFYYYCLLLSAFNSKTFCLRFLFCYLGSCSLSPPLVLFFTLFLSPSSLLFPILFFPFIISIFVLSLNNLEVESPVVTNTSWTTNMLI